MSAKGSELKRVKQSRKANARNKHYKSMLKNAIKAVEEAPSGNRQDQYKKAVSVIDKVSSKGVIHKNKASRKKSRLAKVLNK